MRMKDNSNVWVEDVLQLQFILASKDIDISMTEWLNSV